MKRKKTAVYASAFDMEFSDVEHEPNWQVIGKYLQSFLEPEPPPAKKGTFEKWLGAKGFPAYEIKILLNLDKLQSMSIF